MEGPRCLQAPQKRVSWYRKGIQDKTREFKRSGCLFIDLGLVRAAPSITVVQKFLLMAPSAGVPIWFVFVTFGLGHLFGNNMRICQCQIQTRITCLTPCSRERGVWAYAHASGDGHSSSANEQRLTIPCPWKKAKERVGQASLKRSSFPFLPISSALWGGPW